jgi:hypothetical protein
MSTDLSQLVATGAQYVRLESTLGGFFGGQPLGWADLPQIGVFYFRAYMNASIAALTIDPDSDWPWVGVRGPAGNNLQLTGPAPNTGLAIVGSPMLSQIVSADIPAAQRVSPYAAAGPYGANIAALTTAPREIFGTGSNFPIDINDTDFYTYWDNSLANDGFPGGLILRCTVWFAPLPPLAVFPLRRYNWQSDNTFAITGGGATDICGKIPMFGRHGCTACSSEGTAGDIITVKGVKWNTGGGIQKPTLFTVTVPASGSWSFEITDNLYDAIEINVTAAGGATTMRIYAEAWDR